MSRIVVRIEASCNIPELIRVLRPITRCGVASLRAALSAGQPVFEVDLFHNDHDDIAQRLRDLVESILPPLGTLRLEEIADSDSNSCSAGTGDPITTETLLNMLREHDSGIQRYEESTHGDAE